MRSLLKLEELAQFLFCVLVLLYSIGVPWWVFLLLLLGPDIGMVGYLVNVQVGAVTYNLLHHKGVAILLGLCGYTLGLFTGDVPEVYSMSPVLLVTAFILYGHASLDRSFGFGLKFGDGFQYTYMGWIGKKAVSVSEVHPGR